MFSERLQRFRQDTRCVQFRVDLEHVYVVLLGQLNHFQMICVNIVRVESNALGAHSNSFLVVTFDLDRQGNRNAGRFHQLAVKDS